MILGIPFCNPKYYCSPNNCKSFGQPSVIKNTTWRGHTVQEQQGDGCTIDRRHHNREMGTTRKDSPRHWWNPSIRFGHAVVEELTPHDTGGCCAHALQEGGGAGGAPRGVGGHWVLSSVSLCGTRRSAILTTSAASSTPL
nr:uncharacterized protein LOC117840387 [Setaria viridis]